MAKDICPAGGQETAAVNQVYAPDFSGKLIRVPFAQGQERILFMAGSAAGGGDPEFTLTGRNAEGTAFPGPGAVQVKNIQAALPQRNRGR